MPYVHTCLRALNYCVLTCLRAFIFHVLTCLQPLTKYIEAHFYTLHYCFSLEYLQKQPPEVFFNKILFNKIAGLRPATLLKKKLWHRCFPMNFAKFLRRPFLRNTSGRLLLYLTFHSIQYPKINPCF